MSCPSAEQLEANFALIHRFQKDVDDIESMTLKEKTEDE
jgi:hypothetical protein